MLVLLHYEFKLKNVLCAIFRSAHVFIIEIYMCSKNIAFYDIQMSYRSRNIELLKVQSRFLF